MHCIHAGEIDAALAVIDEHSAQIHADRREVEQTLDILHTTSTFLEVLTEANDKHKQGLRIGEAAKLVNVRVSAVRFWETQGLLTPIRDRESKYRLYDDEQIRRLQVVALLRKSGYDFDAIRGVLQQLATGTPEQVRAAAERRLQDLAEVSRRAIEATATLWQYIVEIRLLHHTP